MKELKFAQKLSLEAGQILKNYYEKDFKVRKKGRIDLVTEVDERIQAQLIKKINKEFPGDIVWAEEGSYSEAEAGSRRWIIDPLDGTTNYRFGFPFFCVSIAFEKNLRLEAGVVYDPLRKELFHAQRKQGAYLNNQPLRVRQERKLADAFLVTGFPYDLEDTRINNLPYFSHFLKKALAVRRDGSAALNLAYVACGRFSGFWEYGLNAWDVAAGVLLVREAGGKIIRLCNTLPEEYPSHLIAANARLAKLMEQEIHLCSQDVRPFGFPDSFL